MKEKEPLISVLICVFDAEQFVAKTIQSVLKQSYDNYEVLILDNNSEDSSLKVIEEFALTNKRIKIIRSKKNLGPFGGLNKLLDCAKGKYIAILDHDDIWHPYKLRMQIDILEHEPKYIGCGTLPLKYYEKENAFKRENKKEVSSISSHSSLVFHNDGFRYDISVRYKTDQYFMKYVLCKKKEKIYNLQKPLLLNRFRADLKNYNYSWITLSNLMSFFRKTKDYRILTLAIIKMAIPLRALFCFEKYGSKPIEELRKDKLTKLYFDEGLLP